MKKSSIPGIVLIAFVSVILLSSPARALEDRVLMVNVHGSHYDGDGYSVYLTLVNAGADATYVNLSSSGQVAALLAANTYDQIWVFDLSYGVDSYPPDWQAIADWYLANPDMPVICDSRMISSYWSGRYLDEGQRLTENYYFNLRVRGGGLLLGTDHDVYVSGINTIVSLIGMNPFFGTFSLTTIPVDTGSPLMTTPNDMGTSLFDDSSPGQTQYGIQPNGRFFYTLAWHSGNPDTPGISSTIEGGIGFHVAIVDPVDGAHVSLGDPMTFNAEPYGGEAPYSYDWFSDIDGALGSGETIVVSTLSLGTHYISVEAEDGGGRDDEDQISVVVEIMPVYVDDNSSCVAGCGSQSNPWPTIQQGINDAPSTGSVIVFAGNYPENINFNGKAVTVESSAGAGSTVITAQGKGYGVTFASGETPASVLDGFTVQGGSPGGILCSNNSEPVILNCTVSNNAGYGIRYQGSSSPTIEGCTIEGNTQGGVSCSGALGTVTHSRISGNSGANGGGLSLDQCTTSVINNEITGNSATADGGGIYSSGSTATITNNTVSGNSAGQRGGGLAAVGGSTLTVTNTILWDDSAVQGAEIYEDGTSACTVRYSDVEGVWPGLGNISADPAFAGVGDYHLQDGSPCIDIGDSGAAGMPTSDLDEDPRIMGAAVDMGADEATGTISDSDQDGVPDVLDNCPDYQNPTQSDNDYNGVGDACESNVNNYIRANSGDDGQGLPSWDPVLRIYEDIFRIFNRSDSQQRIQLPMAAVLKSLTPSNVMALNTDNQVQGSGRPPIGAWRYTLMHGDGFSGEMDDGLMDPNEMISRTWRVYDPDSVTFYYWVDVMAAGIAGVKGGREAEIAEEEPMKYGHAPEERMPMERIEPGVPIAASVWQGGEGDGEADLFVGSDAPGLIMARRFEGKGMQEEKGMQDAREVSFFVGGEGVGRDVDVILYFDPAGKARVPDREMEILRQRVHVDRAGLQRVRIARKGPFLWLGRGGVLFVGLENLPGGSYSLGMDSSVPGVELCSYSEDGGLSFLELEDDSIMNALPMIRLMTQYQSPLRYR